MRSWRCPVWRVQQLSIQLLAHTKSLPNADDGQPRTLGGPVLRHMGRSKEMDVAAEGPTNVVRFLRRHQRHRHVGGDRKSVVSGKSVSVRVDLGGRRILKKTNKDTANEIHHYPQKVNKRERKYHKI